jgi:8-oxo-dGTP diphosphatase
MAKLLQLKRGAIKLLLYILIMRHSLCSAVSTFHSRTRRTPTIILSSRRFSTAISEMPQAAVAVSVRCRRTTITNNDTTTNHYYLMIQRGKPPNKGKWSIPGGRLLFGETALQGGVRELAEETIWENQAVFQSMQWCKETVCTSDYIGQGYHYLIAQCFAEIECHEDLPIVRADDDADDAKWFLLDKVKDWSDKDLVSEGVYEVFCRMEELANHGLLPTTERPYK